MALAKLSALQQRIFVALSLILPTWMLTSRAAFASATPRECVCRPRRGLTSPTEATCSEYQIQTSRTRRIGEAMRRAAPYISMIHGKLVGRGDFAVQVHQTFANLGRALAAAGALPNQVAKITIYVVDYQRDDQYPIIEKARVALFGDHKPANVVMGVAALSPDYLIEVDAVAVVDG